MTIIWNKDYLPIKEYGEFNQNGLPLQKRKRYPAADLITKWKTRHYDKDTFYWTWEGIQFRVDVLPMHPKDSGYVPHRFIVSLEGPQDGPDEEGTVVMEKVF